MFISFLTHHPDNYIAIIVLSTSFLTVDNNDTVVNVTNYFYGGDNYLAMSADTVDGSQGRKHAAVKRW